MASYTLNEAAVANARRLIEARQYVLDSEWGDVQPDADAENAFLDGHSWADYADWHLGLTVDAHDETKARFGFVYGDFRRVHRSAIDRLRLPGVGVAPQAGRARGPRSAAAARRHRGLSERGPPGPGSRNGDFDMVEVVSIADVIEITDEQRTAFTDEGYVVVRNVLDGAARSALAGAIEASRLSPSPHYGVLSAAGTPRVDSDLFRTDLDGIAALSRTSPLPAIAGALLGSSPAVVFVEDQWFASAPGASTMSPWHQDSPYYAIDSPFVTMWCPIDPVPSGAELRVVPGSHLWGKSFAPVAFVAGEGRQTTDEHPLEAVPHITDQMAVAADARAGDVVAFDARLLHSAGGHVDHDFRRFSLRYAAADARYVRPPWPIADFWDELAHGLVDGDALACDAFPLVGG